MLLVSKPLRAKRFQSDLRGGCPHWHTAFQQVLHVGKLRRNSRGEEKFPADYPSFYDVSDAKKFHEENFLCRLGRAPLTSLLAALKSGYRMSVMGRIAWGVHPGKRADISGIST
jgi:hypothetical protein